MGLKNKKQWEILIIPFDTIVKFYDPFVKFSIQLDFKEQIKQTKRKMKKKEITTKKKIISLEDFRKKNE